MTDYPLAETTHTRPVLLSRLTIADALFLLVGALAAVQRFVALDALPLSPAESSQALTVWSFWQPAGSVADDLLAALVNAVSPAYFSLTSLFMFVLGDSDTVMRLVPALAGLGLVLLPWLLCHRLTSAGALTTSFLLALSPTMVAISRTAGGDALALFAAVLLLCAWLRYQESGVRAWLLTAAVALGLGLTTSALFYSALLVLVVAWLLQMRVGPQLQEVWIRPERHELRQAAIVGGAVFLALGTSLLWNLSGLGAAAAALGDWLTAFTLRGTLQEWLDPLLMLGRYELPLYLLGTIALAWAAWRGRPLPNYFVYVFAVALLLLLFQHFAPSNALLLVVAAYFLVGAWAGVIFAPRPEIATARLPIPAGLMRALLLVALLICGAVFYFNLARHLHEYRFNNEQVGFLLLAVIALVVAVALANFAATWQSAIALQGSLLAVLLLLSVYAWGTAWWLGHEGGNDPRERWPAAETTDDDVRMLARTLMEISQDATNANHELEVLVAVEAPQLRWYLRHFRNARFGPTVPPEVTPQAVITPAGTELFLPADYTGADFGYRRLRTTEGASTLPSQVLRWWLFHESTQALRQENVILWVRTDLILRLGG